MLLKKNIEKGMKSLKSHDNYLTILNHKHLIVRDILDCVNIKDLLKLCNI